MTENANAWVSAALTTPTAGAERRDVAARLAAHYLRAGMAPAAVLRTMDPYRHVCDPPMTAVELAETVAGQAAYHGRAAGAGVIAPPLETPTLTGWRYVWPEGQVGMTIERLTSRAGRIDAELVVTSDAPGKPRILVGPAAVNLVSIPAREQLARYLDKRLPMAAWGEVLETAFRLAILAHRAGVPSVRLADTVTAEADGYAIDPLIVEGDPTLLYARGGAGKSMLALAIAAALDGADGVLPLPVKARHRVAYLDWEWTRARHYKRLAMMLSPDQLDACGILYRRMAGGLASQVDQLARMVETEGVTYIVVDSLGMAAGGDPEKADTALAFAGAVRALGVGSLWVSHVTKAHDADTPFGSAYWTNAVRSAWQVQCHSEPGASVMRLALVQRKANSGPPVDPISLRLDFSGGRLAIARTDIYQEAVFQSTLPPRARILSALAGGALALDDLHTATGLTARDTKPVLAILTREHRVVELTGGRYGLAAPNGAPPVATVAEDVPLW